MKAKAVFGWLVLGAVLCAAPAPANPFPNTAPVPGPPLASSNRPANQLRDRVTEWIGSAVTSDTQTVGNLSDIVFDLRHGRISFAVITTTEDNRRIAVPASLLQAQMGSHALKLLCDEQHFRAAPDFSKSDLSDPSWAGATDAAFAPHASAPLVAAGPVMVEAAGAELPSGVFPPESTVPSAPSRPAISLVRASDLVGSAVRDSAGQPVGDIKDVAVAWAAGKMAFAALDPSGTVGLGNRYIPVAPDALRLTPAGGSFAVSVTKSQLASAPSFDRARWPSASDNGFVARVNQFFTQAAP